jgi:hypothetical protein
MRRCLSPPHLSSYSFSLQSKLRFAELPVSWQHPRFIGMARRVCCGISLCAVWLEELVSALRQVSALLLLQLLEATTRYAPKLLRSDHDIDMFPQFKYWFMYFLIGFVAVTLSACPKILCKLSSNIFFFCSYGRVLSQCSAGAVQYWWVSPVYPMNNMFNKTLAMVTPTYYVICTSSAIPVYELTWRSGIQSHFFPY